MRENWKRAISDKSSFAHTMEEASRAQFQASIGSGFKKILSGNGQISVIGQNNEKVNFNVSEETSRAFEKTAAKVRSESLQQTLQDSKSLNYMTKLAKQIGASKAYSYLNDAREMGTSSESYGADLTTALIRNYASERYGSESPINIRHAISDFNHFLTQQGSQGVDNMQSIVKGFVGGHGYGWGSTTDAVHDSISTTRNHVQRREFKHDISMSTNNAGAETFTIKKENFFRPQADKPIDNPNAGTVTNPASDIRNRNRLEESGKGGIHTAPGELAKEMIGLKKGAPPRPTHDLYRNQSFYYEGNLVQPQNQKGGIVLPSGMVIQGDAIDNLPNTGKEFWKGSVFEKD